MHYCSSCALMYGVSCVMHFTSFVGPYDLICGALWPHLWSLITSFVGHFLFCAFFTPFHFIFFLFVCVKVLLPSLILAVPLHKCSVYCTFVLVHSALLREFHILNNHTEWNSLLFSRTLPLYVLCTRERNPYLLILWQICTSTLTLVLSLLLLH